MGSYVRCENKNHCHSIHKECYRHHFSPGPFCMLCNQDDDIREELDGRQIDLREAYASADCAYCCICSDGFQQHQDYKACDEGHFFHLYCCAMQQCGKCSEKPGYIQGSSVLRRYQCGNPLPPKRTAALPSVIPARIPAPILQSARIMQSAPIPVPARALILPAAAAAAIVYTESEMAEKISMMKQGYSAEHADDIILRSRVTRAHAERRRQEKKKRKLQTVEEVPLAVESKAPILSPGEALAKRQKVEVQQSSGPSTDVFLCECGQPKDVKLLKNGKKKLLAQCRRHLDINKASKRKIAQERKAKLATVSKESMDAMIEQMFAAKQCV